MNDIFLPEGRLLLTQENQAACASLQGLQQAMEQGSILEGTARLCDPNHDLLIQVGPYTGLIPRKEAALGISEGNTREIAILSRVGKPICFTVEKADAISILLSRRKAQERALQHMMHVWHIGDIIPATVTHLEPFGAFVDIGCGIPSLLSLDQISVSRIPHPRQRFIPGQEIFSVITGLDPAQGRVSLSHKALLGTWLENVAQFSPGMTVPGIVRSVKPYGAFVELTPNLSGLAEPRSDLQENQCVSVYIKSIQPERHKIKLLVIDHLPPNCITSPLCYVQTEGRLEHWCYLPEKTGTW